ncbi:MAG: ABC transporter permease, partial [Planctomycetota bacterium]
LLSIVVASFGFSGLMMFLATMGKTEAAVSGSAWGILLILSMLGGGMIPLIAMPGWMQKVSRASPVNWAVTSFEGAIWRGMSLTELAPFLGGLALLGLAGWILGSMRLSRVEA